MPERDKFYGNKFVSVWKDVFFKKLISYSICLCTPVVRPLGEMENDRIAKRIYVRECVGNRSVGGRRKR